MGLGRFETFARLGRIQTAETLFNEASLNFEDHRWRSKLGSDPHGARWHTSFHVSRFPAGDERFCGRKAAYELMAFPDEAPASRMLMGTAIVGQAVEDWNINNLDFDGRLLSAALKAEHQTGFLDYDHWLSGSPDFIVLPPGWNRPHLIETKTKDLEVVVEMKNLQRSYDAGHARQARGYIGLGHRITPLLWPKVVICRKTWRLAHSLTDGESTVHMCRDHGEPLEAGTCLMELELEPLRTGSLIYSGRDRPHTTCEYVFEHDEAWFQSGLAKLKEVQEHFTLGEIPPHPFGGKEWSLEPCKWCDHKRSICRPDTKNAATHLASSAGVERARFVYGEYDPEATMQAVLERWQGKSGLGFKIPNPTIGRSR